MGFLPHLLPQSVCASSSGVKWRSKRSIGNSSSRTGFGALSITQVSTAPWSATSAKVIGCRSRGGGLDPWRPASIRLSQPHSAPMAMSVVS
jgi:hypothetical protein